MWAQSVQSTDIVTTKLEGCGKWETSICSHEAVSHHPMVVLAFYCDKICLICLSVQAEGMNVDNLKAFAKSRTSPFVMCNSAVTHLYFFQV
jgi:uncharacterized CHY-type Zn-finger protein